MKYETLKYEKEDGFIVITMNRPASLNAMNKQFMKEFSQAHLEILKDKDVNVWILTGAPRPDGRPCFSAGADLKEDIKGEKRYSYPEFRGPIYLEEDNLFTVNTAAGRLWTKRPRLPGPMFTDISWSPKISIAAIDGIATAGGIEIALACDLIVVSETAQITDSHVKNLKLAIGGGSVTTGMTRRVGYSKALEILITGDWIDGKEAHRIGLANQLFAPDKLMEGAKKLARTIASMRPAAVQLSKLACRAASDMSFNDAWAYGDEILRWSEFDPEWIGLQGVTQQWDKRGR